MPRYKLTIAYDGSDYCGWQKQEPLEAKQPIGVPMAYTSRTPRIESTRDGRIALRTVQGVVEQAVRRVVREPVVVLGASRTDSGVHAAAQVAAFTCSGDLPPPPSEADPAIAPPSTDANAEAAPPALRTEQQPGIGWPLSRGTDRLIMAINAALPEDVLIVKAEPVHLAFDPIKDATSKGYSYTLNFSLVRPLWGRQYLYWLRRATALNIAAMNQAAGYLLGEHDFNAFAAAGHKRLTTVRTVHACTVSEVARAGISRDLLDDASLRPPLADSINQLVRIDISGNGFLWNMVRIVAGTLLEVGLGKREPTSILKALESRDRRDCGPTLPPEGLRLEWIQYGKRDAAAQPS